MLCMPFTGMVLQEQHPFLKTFRCAEGRPLQVVTMHVGVEAVHVGDVHVYSVEHDASAWLRDVGLNLDDTRDKIWRFQVYSHLQIVLHRLHCGWQMILRPGALLVPKASCAGQEAFQ